MSAPKTDFINPASIKENRESAMQVSHVGRAILQNSTQMRVDRNTIVLIRKQ